MTNTVTSDLPSVRHFVNRNQAWDGADISDDWGDLRNEVLSQGERSMALLPAQLDLIVVHIHAMEHSNYFLTN